VLAIVAVAAMAGVPLLNGFLSKEMFFAETSAGSTHIRHARVIPMPSATLAGASRSPTRLRFIHDVFWNGEAADLPKTPHEPPFWMLVPVGGAGAALPAGRRAAGGDHRSRAGARRRRPVVGGRCPEYSLAIWHGVNLPLLMSAPPWPPPCCTPSACWRWC
jgi:multicomponent K+:H+ antiporter subunit A